MALDDLPGTLEVPARDEIATQYRRDYGLVSPESDTSDGTQPDVLAKTLANTLLPVYSDAVLITGGINEDAATGTRLDRVGARYGVARPSAKGASGNVLVSAAAGGGTIQLGDELKNRQSGKRYEAAETKFVVDGGPIRVRGKDTGPGTNVGGGVTLQWSSPRPGIGQTATVAPIDPKVPLGAGLVGGVDQATDATYLTLIQEARRNPPNADNDAAVQRTVRETPDVAVEAVFTYPGLFGPGTLAYCFTLPGTPGADPVLRIPGTAQITSTLAYMTGQLPSDDSYFALQLLAQPTDLALQITWDPISPGWVDAQPWPQYQVLGAAAGTAGAVVVAFDDGPLSFRLRTDNNDYTNAVQPQVGQSFGFWDPSGLAFRKKQIQSVAGAGPWDVVCNPVTSDSAYTPGATQRAMPWSDSLVDSVAPVLKYMSALGPGEQLASFSGDGRRQRRNPRPPKIYPQAIANDIIVPLLALPSVSNVLARDGLGAAPAVGSLGLWSYILTMRYLSVFP